MDGIGSWDLGRPAMQQHSPYPHTGVCLLLYLSVMGQVMTYRWGQAAAQAPLWSCSHAPQQLQRPLLWSLDRHAFQEQQLQDAAPLLHRVHRKHRVHQKQQQQWQKAVRQVVGASVGWAPHL